MNAPRPRVPTVLWLGGGVLIGLALAGVVAAPEVIRLSPAAGSGQVPARASIRIEFNQAMDPRSTEAHLTIEPRLGGSMRWDGHALIFEPGSAWAEGTTVVVELAAGARSARGIPLLKATRWSFTVGGPRVVFLSPAGGTAQLQSLALADGTFTALPGALSGIEQFRHSPDGTSLVYSTGGEAGEIRRLDLTSLADSLLYSCPPNTRCSSPALSPDGDRLAFVQANLISGLGGQAVAGPSEVWLLNLEPGALPAAVSPADDAASLPDWSPQGWLVYYDHTRKAFAVVDPAGGPQPEPFQFYPSEIGEPGSWSPDGTYFVFPDIDFVRQDLAQGPSEAADLFFSHLYRWPIGGSDVTDLSLQTTGRVEDASPAYSPDGRWLAFARKYLEPGRWTLGRQLWLMGADGSEPRPLTHEPVFNHSSISWNADSDSILFMRFNQSEISQPPEVWLYDLGQSSARLLAVGGFLPQWIP